jgi:hypothetical protein
MSFLIKLFSVNSILCIYSDKIVFRTLMQRHRLTLPITDEMIEKEQRAWNIPMIPPLFGKQEVGI